MKKRFLFPFLLLLYAITTSAQLKVDSAGRVGIMTNNIYRYSYLTVGNTGYPNASVGIISSPNITDNINIGVLGSISTNSTYTNDTNYGVFGAAGLKFTHGRNYGVSGMIGPLGQHYGGTGVYGTNSLYYYSYPTNIQGDHAGYFEGPVHVTGNITAPSIFMASDSRLCDNFVTLNERDNSGKATLGNVLNMNVVEYNLKSRLSEEMPDDIDSSEVEKVRRSFEYLKKEEKEMTSRRHFGVDAKELQRIYPNLVLEGQDGYLSVNYSELVPLLIRSIQVLKQELDEIKSKSNARRASTEMDSPAASNRNVLYQNKPNPFKELTIIRFKLVEEAQDASICIFDMTGKLLKKLPISSGMESVSIGGYELGEGMFLYSLIVNGQEIDTKKMVIQ